MTDLETYWNSLSDVQRWDHLRQVCRKHGQDIYPIYLDNDETFIKLNDGEDEVLLRLEDLLGNSLGVVRLLESLNLPFVFV